VNSVALTNAFGYISAPNDLAPHSNITC